MRTLLNANNSTNMNMNNNNDTFFSQPPHSLFFLLGCRGISVIIYCLNRLTLLCSSIYVDFIFPKRWRNVYSIFTSITTVLLVSLSVLFYSHSKFTVKLFCPQTRFVVCAFQNVVAKWQLYVYVGKETNHSKNKEHTWID